jgi:hypothetical protein
LYVKTNILPRQARDKHRENSPKRDHRLSSGYHTADQLASLNITKPSHVKKLLKQAKKQRGKLGLPELDEDTDAAAAAGEEDSGAGEKQAATEPEQPSSKEAEVQQVEAEVVVQQVEAAAAEEVRPEGVPADAGN